MRAHTADLTASLTALHPAARLGAVTLKAVGVTALTLGMLTALAAAPASAEDPPMRVGIEQVEVYPDSGHDARDRHKRIVVEGHRDLDIEVWTRKGDNARYCVGEPIEIYFRTNRDAYVALYNTDTRGRTHKLFPNRYDRDNFVRGGKTYRLPARGYDFYIEGPQGRESIKAVAALDKRDLRLGRNLPASYDGYDESYGDEDYGHEWQRDRGYERERVHASYTTVDHDGDGDRDGRLKIGVERIVTVPDPDYDHGHDLAVDVTTHRVRDGRSCRVRKPHPRRWWD